jgi:hypothetical protein
MKLMEGKFSFLKYIIFMSLCQMLWPLMLFAAQIDENQAPGRAMARQAIKGLRTWNTTDHSKHEVLQKDFKSGLEVTRACLSCHSEAEAQFHKSIHWTWRADPRISNLARPEIRSIISASQPTKTQTKAAWPVTRAGALPWKAASIVSSVTVKKI